MKRYGAWAAVILLLVSLMAGGIGIGLGVCAGVIGNMVAMLGLPW